MPDEELDEQDAPDDFDPHDIPAFKPQRNVDAESVPDFKAHCPITFPQFKHFAEPILVQIGLEKKVAVPKLLSTGSFGWHFSEKLVIMVGDVPVRVTANCNFTVIHSKHAPR